MQEPPRLAKLARHGWTEPDFAGATLRRVSFDHCRLIGADFSKATLEEVDLRGSEVGIARGYGALRGAFIDPAQLVTIAPAWPNTSESRFETTSRAERERNTTAAKPAIPPNPRAETGSRSSWPDRYGPASDRKGRLCVD